MGHCQQPSQLDPHIVSLQLFYIYTCNNFFHFELNYSHFEIMAQTAAAVEYSNYTSAVG